MAGRAGAKEATVVPGASHALPTSSPEAVTATVPNAAGSIA